MSTGTPDVPSKAGISIAGIATGMYAYSGILAALYDTERTGRGISLQMAMLDALGELRTQPAYFSRYGGELPRRSGRDIHLSVLPVQGRRRFRLPRYPERQGMARFLPRHPAAAGPSHGCSLRDQSRRGNPQR